MSRRWRPSRWARLLERGSWLADFMTAARHGFDVKRAARRVSRALRGHCRRPCDVCAIELMSAYDEAQAVRRGSSVDVGPLADAMVTMLGGVRGYENE